MFIYFKTLIAIALASCICMHLYSCQNKSDMEVRLERIGDEIMTQDPDSALILLSAISEDELTSKREVALHSLFMELARYKSHVDLSDDSSVTHAYRFFRNHGDKRYAMMAMFLKAEIQFEENNYAHSVISAMQAEELAIEQNDHYYLGRIYDLLADINYNTYNFSETQELRNRAAESFKMADSVAQHYFALTELATIYAHNGMPEKSIELLDSLSHAKELNHYNDYNLSAYRLSCYLMPLLKLKKYNLIDSVVDKMSNYSDFEFSIYTYANIIEAYVAQGRFADADKMIKYCNGLFSNEINYEISFQEALYEYYKALGDYENALKHQGNVLIINNERINDALNQTVAIAQRDYHNLKSRRYEAKSKRLRNLIIIICIAVMVSGAWAIMFFKERMRRKNSEINSHVSDIQRLSEDVLNESRRSEQLNAELNKRISDNSKLNYRINTNTERFSELTEQIHELMRSRFAVLNSLCDEYFAVRDTPKQKTLLYNKLKSEIHSLCSEESITEIESLVDRCMDGIVSKLREQFPNFKPVDITISSLIFANFSPRTICLIIGKELGYYYNKRKRLKDRISQSDAPDKNLFLENFDNNKSDSRNDSIRHQTPDNHANYGD